MRLRPCVAVAFPIGTVFRGRVMPVSWEPVFMFKTCYSLFIGKTVCEPGNEETTDALIPQRSVTQAQL